MQAEAWPTLSWHWADIMNIPFSHSFVQIQSLGHIPGFLFIESLPWTMGVAERERRERKIYAYKIIKWKIRI